ncbi:MAG: NDP-sugar synthase [Erysipelotrichaceae bacterium]
MRPALVILAAGMGSRYGGLKQIDAVGNNGESIIDFSIYDAIRAGFKKVYLIIREEHQELFEENLSRKIRPFIDVEYVYQSITDVPRKFNIPSDREKPLGTTHALRACRDQVKEPFAIINADDYYGIDAFKIIYKFLQEEVKDYHYGIIAYKTFNTLSNNGSVTRGICQEKDGYLTDIKEIQKIYLKDHLIHFENNGEIGELSGDEPCSMNYWGFNSSIFKLMDEQFEAFLERSLNDNPYKCEHVIPTAIGELISLDKIKVKVMTSEEQWFGVTYQSDKPYVEKQLEDKKDSGLYPFNLWEK